jgi:Uncharacterized protein conserved in bacteria (DUF2252)
LARSLALLEEQAAERVRDLVPTRYGRMSASPFAFSSSAGPRDLYLRQVGLEDLRRRFRDAAIDLTLYARLCAWTLARAHARSGDSIEIAGYLGSSEVFDRAIAAFAESYADHNERDHAALVDAIATGRVQANAEA